MSKKKVLSGPGVLVSGLAGEVGVGADREPPSHEIIELLERRRAGVACCNPHIPVMSPSRSRDLALASVPGFSR